MGSIRIGNSGWSYDDWIGPFYPEGTKKDEMLRYYLSRFETVEVNSTFCIIPSKRTVMKWAKECSNFKSREITIKAPMTISHELAMEDAPERMEKALISFSNEVLEPLSDQGVLGAVLFQASPYFTVRGDIKYKMKSEPVVPLPKYVLGIKRLGEIAGCLAQLPGEPALELRNSAWLNEDLRLRGEAVDVLRENGTALAVIDGPSFPWFSEETSRHAYIRFHGRNKEGWFRSDELDREARYQYEYDENELRSRMDDLKIISSKVGDDTRVFFNNHPRGMAPKNAMMLMDILDIDHPRGPLDDLQ